MPIEVKWDKIEHPTLCYKFQDPWEWNEFYSITAISQQMRAQVGAEDIHFIVDFSASSFIPMGVISYFSNVVRNIHASKKRSGMVVFVNKEPFLNAIDSVIAHLFPKASQTVRKVETVEEAHALLSTKTRKPVLEC